MPNFELPSSATQLEGGKNASSNPWDNASRSDKQKHTTEPEASSKACSSRWESSGQTFRNATGSNRAANQVQVTGTVRARVQKRHGAGNEQQNAFKSLGLFVSNFEQPSSATEPEAGNKTCSSHRNNPSRTDHKSAPRCRKRAAKRVQVAGKMQAKVLKRHGTGTEQQGMFKSLGQFMLNSQDRHGAGNWQQNLFKSLGTVHAEFRTAVKRHTVGRRQKRELKPLGQCEPK